MISGTVTEFGFVSGSQYWTEILVLITNMKVVVLSLVVECPIDRWFPSVSIRSLYEDISDTSAVGRCRYARPVGLRGVVHRVMVLIMR